MSNVSFKTEKGDLIRAGANTFLLFIDETGGESLSDPNFPIFGFGAAGLPAQRYFSNIVKPWIFLKEKEFGGKNIPLHATDLRKPSKQQLEILNKFFTRCAFCRIAVILSDRTTLDQGVDRYNLVARTFYDKILDVLKWSIFDKIFMIFEDSERTNKLNTDYFSRYNFNREDEKGKSQEIPCRRFLMHKSELEPGLEVADFTAHTAGASVYSRLKGRRSKANERKDFESIFKSGDKRLSSFLEITNARLLLKPDVTSKS